jgi:hypothetical protein
MEITYGSVCSGIEAATLAVTVVRWIGMRILRQLNSDR